MNADIVNIAIDAMGGDNSPEEIVAGAICALSNESIKILFVGIREKINEQLKLYDYDKSRVEVVEANEIIYNDETPTVAIKKKKNSSIMVGLNLLKEGKAVGFISAGNTGALLTGATLVVGRIKGIQRPALATHLPNKKGISLLVDSGANVDCKPDYLVQFADMGSAYMKSIFGILTPKVALINIGTEDQKGNILAKESFQMLKNSNINFVGNIEARDISEGNVDVIVCDGFVGNIILKYAEGFASSLLQILKDEFTKKSIYKLGAFMAKGAFKSLKKKMDYEHYGGAPFLGLNSLIIKAHGSSKRKSIEGAVNQCFLSYKNNLIQEIDQNYFLN